MIFLRFLYWTEFSPTVIQSPGFTNNYKFCIGVNKYQWTFQIKFCLPFCYLLIAPKWRVRINPRSRTKGKTYMINLQFLQNWEGKKVNRVSKIPVRKWDMCWRNFCVFSLVTRTCEKYVKNSIFFFKWAPFWNLISKKRK